MSYFRMCVLFCQEENRRISESKGPPYFTELKQTYVQAKTFHACSGKFLVQLAQHPKVPQ